MSDNDRQHHLLITSDDMAGNDGLGRYVLIPGSPSRARLIADLFDEQQREIITPRHNDTFLGRIQDQETGRWIDVAAVSSGMGTGSTEIITMELLQTGARRLVRVGTSGAIRWQDVGVGSFVIATGAVRDDATSDHYVPKSYPAVAHPDVVSAYARAARRLGIADRTFRGIIQSKASLYARATFAGPLGEEHRSFKRIMNEALVLSSEMESSTLFVMASCLGESALALDGEQRHPQQVIKAGTILGIIGGKDAWASPEQIADIERQTCQWGLEGIRQLHHDDFPP